MKGVAVATLFLAAAYLEVKGHSADGLWFIGGLWVFFGNGSAVRVYRGYKESKESD